MDRASVMDIELHDVSALSPSGFISAVCFLQSWKGDRHLALAHFPACTNLALQNTAYSILGLLPTPNLCSCSQRLFAGRSMHAHLSKWIE